MNLFYLRSINVNRRLVLEADMLGMKKILVFIGPPGSGKGTQAKKVAQKYGHKHISIGDLIRDMVNNPDITREQKKIIDDSVRYGKLAPDSFVCNLIFGAVEKNLNNSSGIVFDGAIRTLEQAKEMQKYLEKKNLIEEMLVVAIMIGDEEAFARLTKRRVCQDCQEIIPWVGEAKKFTVCPKCGGALSIRRDDSEEIIKDRIDKQGSKALQPILDYCQKAGILKIVDGMGTIEEVEAGVDKVITL